MESCSHIAVFKANEGLTSYETILKLFLQPNSSHPISHKALVSCFDCERFSPMQRIMACLSCIHFGCFDTEKSHAVVHAINNSHFLCVEFSNGSIYCHVCEDHIQDNEVDEVHCQFTNVEEDDIKSIHSSKKLRIDGRSFLGVRGIINSGNTCFMNCIMQAFMHSPMLRDYFFCDQLNCHDTREQDCLICQFFLLFQEYYNGQKSNLSLHHILYLVWKNDCNLSGYGQKDAHEFFNCVINLLHRFFSYKNTEPCDCIIDKIFHGKLKSDLVCSACGNVSSKIDLFRDISLDIPDIGEINMYKCLLQFIKKELLGTTCSVCKANETTTIQLTFSLLPLVIVIHLKRFQGVQKKDKIIYKKKSTHVPFPLELDMSTFVSGNPNQIQHQAYNLDFTVDNRYTLYSVIEHTGSLEGGHYISYIRLSEDKWFKCDDDKVYPVELEELLRSEAYILFYQKTTIPYTNE